MPFPYPLPQSPIPQQQAQPVAELPSLTDLAAQAIAAIDAQQAPQRVEPIDPRRMMWAGLLSDIGQYVADPFRYQMRGLGPSYFSNAMQYNREADAFNTQIANIGAEKARQKLQILSMLPAEEKGKVGAPVVGRNGNYWIPVDDQMTDTGVQAPYKDVYGAQGSGGGERTKYDIKTYPDKTSSTGFREFYLDPYNPTAPRIAGSEVSPPPDYATASRNAEDEILRINAQMNVSSYESKEIMGKIDSALNNISGLSTGWAGVVFENLPESEAKALSNDLATIKARLSKDKLQEMRALSENGASGYGQLTQLELKNLEDQIEALDPKVGAEKLKQQIENIKYHYMMANYYLNAGFAARKQLLLEERVLPGSSVRGMGSTTPPAFGGGGMPSANDLITGVLVGNPAMNPAQNVTRPPAPAPIVSPMLPVDQAPGVAGPGGQAGGPGRMPTAEELIIQAQGAGRR